MTDSLPPDVRPVWRGQRTYNTATHVAIPIEVARALGLAPAEQERPTVTVTVTVMAVERPAVDNPHAPLPRMWQP